MCERAYYGDELLGQPAATNQEPAHEPLQKHAVNQNKYDELASHPHIMKCCWHRLLRAMGSKKWPIPVPKTGPALAPKAGTKNDTILGP